MELGKILIISINKRDWEREEKGGGGEVGKEGERQKGQKEEQEKGGIYNAL